jgi:GT2 family glycosyltransferase
MKKELYIVIPSFNRKTLLLRCLDSLSKQTYKDFGVILTDDGSTDGTEDAVRTDYPEVIIVKGNGNWWWTRSINEACKRAMAEGCDYLMTLNDDLLVKADYLEIMVKAATKHPRSMIGSLVVSDESKPRLIYAGVEKENHWIAKTWKRGNRYREYDWSLHGIVEDNALPGRGVIYPAGLIDEIGFYDEKSFPQYAADKDFSLRAKKAGYKILINLDGIIYSNIDATGDVKVGRKMDLRQIVKSFFSFKSSNNIQNLWILTVRHFPHKWYIPVAFPLNLFRTVIGALKCN